jgi:hypothetical protein
MEWVGLIAGTIEVGHQTNGDGMDIMVMEILMDGTITFMVGITTIDIEVLM